jgi:hypothetical protein
MTIGCRRLVASLSIFAITAACLAPLHAAGLASFGGRVVGMDGITPFVGAVVHLVGEDGVAVGRSRPTANDGSFAIDPAPTGRYRLLVETERGSFLAPEPVSLEAGVNPAVSLTLKAAGPSFQFEPGLGSGNIPTWGKYAIIGGIAVAGLFVIHEVSEDEEEDASPF